MGKGLGPCYFRFDSSKEVEFDLSPYVANLSLPNDVHRINIIAVLCNLLF